MCCNAIGTTKLCQHRCRNWVWLHCSPRLPNRGDVVNINAKCQHLRSSPELFCESTALYIT
jgi:hypothetical protein